MRTILLIVLSALALAAQTQTKIVTITITDTANPWPGISYNLYRLTGGCPLAAPAPLPAKLATFTGKTYADSLATPGLYCYFATASINGAESKPSGLVLYTWAPAAPGLDAQ